MYSVNGNQILTADFVFFSYGTDPSSNQYRFKVSGQKGELLLLANILLFVPYSCICLKVLFLSFLPCSPQFIESMTYLSLLLPINRISAFTSHFKGYGGI